MAQKNIVQDGRITYSTSDPTLSVDFDINGQLSVTKQLNVGDDPLADGLISTPANVDLIISTGTGGNIRLASAEEILLNNVVWPDGTVVPNPGMYMGVSNVNTLQFYPFVIAFVGTDALTVSQLNASYPQATAGQAVIGPTVIYQCVGDDMWRTVGNGGGGGAPSGAGNSIQYNNSGSFGSNSDMLISTYIWDIDPISTLLVGAGQTAAQITFGQDISDSETLDYATAIKVRLDDYGLNFIARPSTLLDSGSMSYPVNENIGGTLNFLSGYSSTPPDPCQGRTTIAEGANLLLAPASSELSGFVYQGWGGDVTLASGSARRQNEEVDDREGAAAEISLTGGSFTISGTVGGDINLTAGHATDFDSTNNLGSQIKLSGADLSIPGEVTVYTAGQSQLYITYPDTNDAQNQPTVIILGTGFRVSMPYTPSSSTAYGNQGQMAWDSNFFYVCVANNSWKRITLNSF